jgi:hypothetical protein
MPTDIHASTFHEFLRVRLGDRVGYRFVEDFICDFSAQEGFCISAERLVEKEFFQRKNDVKRRLGVLQCIKGVDYVEIVKDSTGGRPAKQIMLTGACYKQLCMLACNKAGEQHRKSYLEVEALFKEHVTQEFITQLHERNTTIDKLSKDLATEQLDTLKTKKSLVRVQKRFSHRHKFRETHCVYIIENPDIAGRYKFGMTDNINERLASDRTMVPNLKVRALFYTEFARDFEKCIKLKHREDLVFQAHEWVSIDLETLILSYNNIDCMYGFLSVREENLWRYNLENPPEEVPVTCGTSARAPANIPKTQNTMDEELSHILPTRVLRHEYRLKTKEAPEGYRYCNGFCQVYQPTISFTMRSNYLLTLCTGCERMADVAKVRLETGTVTEEEIRGDPSILKIAEDEMVCRKCSKVLKKTDFPEKRRQCSKCRDANRSKHGAKFDDKVGSEVEILKTLSEGDVCLKLGTYVKTELQKIMTFVGVGRKYNDNKGSMIEKLRDHFHVSAQLI